jgi:hypothetical protein
MVYRFSPLLLLISLAAGPVFAGVATAINVKAFCYMPGLYEAGGTNYDVGLPEMVDLQLGETKNFAFVLKWLAPYATDLDMSYQGEFNAVNGLKTVVMLAPKGTHAFYWDGNNRKPLLHKVWLTKDEMVQIRLMSTDLGQGSYGSNKILCQLTLK